MKLRTFGLLLLAAVGVFPLGIAGIIILSRARDAALAEVRLGNQQVANMAAAHIGSFAREQTRLLETLAAPLARSAKPSLEQKRRILRNYRIIYPTLLSLDVVGFGAGCVEHVTSRIEDTLRDRCGEPAVETALRGKVYIGPIALGEDLAPVMTVGVPLEVAGEQMGAAIAEVNMEAIWATAKSIHVGKTGYARLLSADGTLIGHGDPEERRRVFLREKDPFIDAIRAAKPNQGALYRNSQGKNVVALAASVPDLGWMVVVEEPIEEAFRGANLMQKDLVKTLIVAAIFGILVGILVGGAPVRAIDRMRRHARTVATGNLEARVEPLPRLAEMRQLAVDLNDMAGELDRLTTDMRSKERLNTFARVAAGLAHDLQTPIESVRAACDMTLTKPHDEMALDLLRSTAETHLPRLHRYVRDLRRLAHDGKISLELAMVSPRQIAERVVADGASSPKWLGVEFVAEGDARNIWADDSLLTRAISNLSANAADACVMRRPPQGRVTIRVSDSEDGRELHIDVIDTGVGISPDKLADLLINDFRSTKRSTGVGLGLAVARHVAVSHGGRITAESSEGAGSTFRIHLPRKVSAEVRHAKGVHG